MPTNTLYLLGWWKHYQKWNNMKRSLVHHCYAPWLLVHVFFTQWITRICATTEYLVGRHKRHEECLKNVLNKIIFVYIKSTWNDAGLHNTVYTRPNQVITGFLACGKFYSWFARGMFLSYCETEIIPQEYYLKFCDVYSKVSKISYSEDKFRKCKEWKLFK